MIDEGDAKMSIWKKIRGMWVDVLEKPFFQAEMHRVEMALHGGKKVRLRLLEGGRNGGGKTRGTKQFVVDGTGKACGRL